MEAFAGGDYPSALAKGDRLSAAERAGDREARWRATPGSRETYVDEADLRIEIQRFCKELLRDERRTVGRLDSASRASTRAA